MKNIDISLITHCYAFLQNTHLYDLLSGGDRNEGFSIKRISSKEFHVRAALTPEANLAILILMSAIQDLVNQTFWPYEIGWKDENGQIFSTPPHFTEVIFLDTFEPSEDGKMRKPASEVFKGAIEKILKVTDYYILTPYSNIINHTRLLQKT